MEILKLQNVNISPESLEAAVRALVDAIEKHTEIKLHLEQILALQQGRARGRARVGRPKVGRPRVGRPRAGRAGGRGRRPPGEMTLREAILAVLSKVKGPLRPVDLRDKVLNSGYKTTATLQSIYTAVFNTARKEPSISKTKEGFRLRAGANGARVLRKKSKRKKASKKRAKRATSRNGRRSKGRRVSRKSSRRSTRK